MTPAFLALNGSGTDVTNGTSISFTTTREISPGERVCVAASCAVGGGDFVSCTVGSLSLTLDKFSDVQTRVFLASAEATTKIDAGATVTFTFAFAADISLGICFSLAGVKTVGAKDKDASSSYVSSSTPASGTTATTSQQDEIAIAVVAHREGPTSITPGSYTEIDEKSATSGANKQGLSVAYKVLTTVGTQSESWTLSSPSYGDALIVVYKGKRPFADAVQAITTPDSLWPMDETSGTTAYDQMGAVNGTYVNTPTLNQDGLVGPFSRSVRFLNSLGSGIDLGDVYNALLLSPFTAMCVIRPYDYNSGSGGNLFSNVGLTANGWALDLTNPAVTFRMQRCDASACDAVTYQYGTVEADFEGESRIIVFVRYDGTNLILNIDGVDVKTQASSRSVTNDATGLRFGAYNAGGSGYDGLASHAAIWTRCLSIGEIQTIVAKAGQFYPERLAGPVALTGVAATIYTAPVQSIIDRVWVSNPSAGAVDLTLSVGTDAAGTRLFDGFAIPADTVREYEVNRTVEKNEIIQASGSGLVISVHGRRI